MDKKQAHSTKKAISSVSSRREAEVCHTAMADGQPVVRVGMVYTGNRYKNVKRNPE